MRTAEDAKILRFFGWKAMSMASTGTCPAFVVSCGKAIPAKILDFLGEIEMAFTFTIGPNRSYSAQEAIMFSVDASLVCYRIAAIAYMLDNGSAMPAPVQPRVHNAELLAFDRHPDGLHVAVFGLKQNSHSLFNISTSLNAAVGGVSTSILIQGAAVNNPVEQIVVTEGSGSSVGVTLPGNPNMGRVSILASHALGAAPGLVLGANQSSTAVAHRAVGVSGVGLVMSYITTETMKDVTATYASLSSASQWVHIGVSLKPYNGTL